jgi:hypothetical protein
VRCSALLIEVLDVTGGGFNVSFQPLGYPGWLLDIKNISIILHFITAVCC